MSLASIMKPVRPQWMISAAVSEKLITPKMCVILRSLNASTFVKINHRLTRSLAQVRAGTHPHLAHILIV